MWVTAKTTPCCRAAVLPCCRAAVLPGLPLTARRSPPYIPGMRALCVARHRFLSEHLCRFFDGLDLDTIPCVGMREALDVIDCVGADIVICEYDLLATAPLSVWQDSPAFSDVPVIAVSMTRHPGEAHLLDINGIAGFLYLPTVEPDEARRLFGAMGRKRGGVMPPNILTWPRTTPTAQLR